MEIHKKLRKSKIFISILIASVLVFSYEVNKPKAFAPLPFLAAIGVGMAAEALVTMGVKAVSKNVLKKQAYNYSDDIQRAGKFDWAGTNPYRNKDGSITLSPTANDRAKMAGLVSGALLGTMAENALSGEDGQLTYVCPPPLETDLTGFTPVTLTMSSGVGKEREDYQKYVHETAMTNSIFSFYSHTDDTNLTRFRVVYNFTGDVILSRSAYGNGAIKATIINAHDDYFDFIAQAGTVQLARSETLLQKSEMNNTQYTSSLNVQNAGYELYNCNGLSVPSSVSRVYPAPMDMSSAYTMPNHDQLSGIDFTINNVYPAGQDEGYVTWDELERYFNDNALSIDDVMEQNIENYLEKGDINNYDITIEEIENIYTDINQEEKVEDFNPPLQENELPVPVPDGGDLIPVEPLDRSILQVMKESYSYLADSIDTAIQAMKNITDGATGIVNYLDQAFRWLPSEWRALFGAAFILGVFAHFFRR